MRYRGASRLFGNTMNVENARWTNSIGSPEPITVREDPELNAVIQPNTNTN